MSEVYRGSCWTVCQRVCSTCRVHMSLQWARPASAASAPIRTRPRTLAGECAPCCRIRTEILVQCIPVSWASHSFFFFFTCMITNSSMRWSVLMSPGGRSNKKEEFHEEPEALLVSLLLITAPSWCRLTSTCHSEGEFKKKSFKLGFSNILSLVCP